MLRFCTSAWPFPLLTLVFLLHPGTLFSEQTLISYQAQGCVYYKTFDPQAGPAPGTNIAGFPEVTLFDLSVRGCDFYCLFKKAPMDPRILYFEMGTDGSNILGQTVFTGAPAPVYRFARRSDGRVTNILIPGVTSSIHRTAAQIHPGIYPKARAFHESVIWLALASHCALPATEELQQMPRLFLYGDNYYQSFTSRVAVAWVSLPAAPGLPASVAFFEDLRLASGLGSYTNARYCVTAVTNVADMEFPSQFTLTRLAPPVKAGLPALVRAMYVGFVTNIVSPCARTCFLPALSDHTVVTDYRQYATNRDGTPFPISNVRSGRIDWATALKGMTNSRVIQLESAFTNQPLRQDVMNGAGPWRRRFAIVLTLFAVAAFVPISFLLRKRGRQLGPYTT